MVECGGEKDETIIFERRPSTLLPAVTVGARVLMYPSRLWAPCRPRIMVRTPRGTSFSSYHYSSPEQAYRISSTNCTTSRSDSPSIISRRTRSASAPA